MVYVWYKLVKCPNCETEKIVKLSQKKCKCPNCKEYYNFK